MQISDLNKRHPLPFLSQLPKERIVLDYVLSKLVKNSSPERYELIAAVFNLHLTSAGFDPMALSKARFKRVKASEFRQALREIDAEVALIMQTEEYRQVLSRQTYLPDLFQQYLQLSSAVRQSGRITSKQFQDFANLLREKDASDLMLGFIRQHKTLFEASLTEEDITDLLHQIQLLMQDQVRTNTQVKTIFELRLNEILSARGVRNTAEIQRIWQYFRDQLAQESGQLLQGELFDKILRSGILTAWPARNLFSYLAFISDKTEAYYFNQYQQRYLLFLRLAEYFTQAGFQQRLQWLDEAEETSRKINNGQQRAYCKLIRSRIMADKGLLAESVKFLDEAEYHVHRIPEKDFEVRNTWIEIARTRMVLYTLQVFEQDTPFHPASFEAQIYLLNDTGKFRSDLQLLVTELNGLTLFLQKNWSSATDAFTKAARLRQEDEEDQPLHLAAKFFCELLEKSDNVAEADILLKQLIEGQETFYSYSWVRLLTGAKHYFEQNAADSQLQ
jgi:hypothetical protein